MGRLTPPRGLAPTHRAPGRGDGPPPPLEIRADGYYGPRARGWASMTCLRLRCVIGPPGAGMGRRWHPLAGKWTDRAPGRGDGPDVDLLVFMPYPSDPGTRGWAGRCRHRGRTASTGPPGAGTGGSGVRHAPFPRPRTATMGRGPGTHAKDSGLEKTRGKLGSAGMPASSPRARG